MRVARCQMALRIVLPGVHVRLPGAAYHRSCCGIYGLLERCRQSKYSRWPVWQRGEAEFVWSTTLAPHPASVVCRSDGELDRVLVTALFWQRVAMSC